MTKYKILDILMKNKGKFISGEKLKEEIGVSRTSIWKGIKSLKEKGYDIEGVNNKGYCLKNDDRISEYEIKKSISTKEIGKKIYYFETLDSTNLFARREIEKLSHGDVIIVEEQSHGKGKKDTVFYSPKESGIYMSIILKKNIFYDSLKILSISTFLAVMKSIEEILSIKIETDWNDILLENKKIAGVLTECGIEFETGDVEYIIVGIGVNVNNSEFPKSAENKNSSIKLLLKKEINRKELVCKILENFEKIICEGRYILNRKKINKEYTEHLNIINKEIEIKNGDRITEGTVEGINNNGGLILRKFNNRKEIFYKGIIRRV